MDMNRKLPLQERIFGNLSQTMNGKVMEQIQRENSFSVAPDGEPANPESTSGEMPSMTSNDTTCALEQKPEPTTESERAMASEDSLNQLKEMIATLRKELRGELDTLRDELTLASRQQQPP